MSNCCNPCNYHPPQCNERNVELNSRYSRFKSYNLNSGTPTITLTENDLLINNIRVNCDGSDTCTPNKYDICFQFDISQCFTYWRKVRQWYQFKKIPINFLTFIAEIRLNGNAEVKVFLNGELFTTFVNDFYSFPTLPTTKAQQIRTFVNYYTQGDDDKFKLSRYYTECLKPIKC